MPIMGLLKREKPDPSAPLGLVHSAIATETDSALVEAVRAGDVGAAGRLYDRHVSSVQGIVYRLLGQKAELDDIVQEVFIYALPSLEKLRDPAALKGWLLGIAVGKVRSHLRSRWRKRWLSFMPNEELPEPTTAADDHQADIVHAVGGILDRLPTEERIALVVHRIQGMSLLDAANVCGMSVSTFKRRLASGESRFVVHAKKESALAGWHESRSA